MGSKPEMVQPLSSVQTGNEVQAQSLLAVTRLRSQKTQPPIACIVTVAMFSILKIPGLPILAVRKQKEAILMKMVRHWVSATLGQMSSAQMCNTKGLIIHFLDLKGLTNSVQNLVLKLLLKNLRMTALL